MMNLDLIQKHTPLFDHLYEKHGLVLTWPEMEEIINVIDPPQTTIDFKKDTLALNKK